MNEILVTFPKNIKKIMMKIKFLMRKLLKIKKLREQICKNFKKK